MRNEENVGHTVRDKRKITSLSLTYKYLLSANSSFIKGSRKTQKKRILFLIND